MSQTTTQSNSCESMVRNNGCFPKMTELSGRESVHGDSAKYTFASLLRSARITGQNEKAESMPRYIATISLIIFAVLTWACADPAAKKPKATVGKAQESNAAKPAEAETLAITPENSKVEFVAAKVTRSHNGSFKKFSGAHA